MSYVSLKEFQSISGLDDSTVLTLIKERKIPLIISSEDDLMVELDKVELDSLITRLTESETEQSAEEEELVLKFSHALSEHFNNALDEAISQLLAEKDG